MVESFDIGWRGHMAYRGRCPIMGHGVGGFARWHEEIAFRYGI